MARKPKEKYFITSVLGDEYYTTDKKLSDMRDKSIDYENMQGLPVLVFLCSFIFIIIPACYIEECAIFPWWCWLLSAIAAAIIIGSILFGCILDKKITYYGRYKELFFKTKEYTKQFNRYRRLEKAKREKELQEKATDLVESYNILEDKQMSKETKINLLKSYIERGEKRK